MTTMPGDLQPLDMKFPIVDANGQPTLYFIKWAQQRQIDITAGITAAQAQALIDSWAAARDVIAGNGLDGGGSLANDITIDANASAILDLLSSTQGTVLYRGASAWAGLAPGTSGHFLKTNGAGANPEWAAASGGGLTVYYNQDNTSGSTGTLPTSQTAVISASIPASGSSRIFVVNGNITWRTGGHGMRGGVLLDTTQVWPNVVGSNQGVDPILTGDGLDHLEYAGILVTVPGDSATHTISLSWEAQSSTAALTIENRQITAIQIA